MYLDWVWRRLVARYLGVVEAAGSNPVTQISLNPLVERIQSFILPLKSGFDTYLILADIYRNLF